MASDLTIQTGWSKSGAERNCQKKNITYNAEFFKDQMYMAEMVDNHASLYINSWEEEELFTVAFGNKGLTVLQLTNCTRLSEDVGAWMNVLANALNQPGCNVKELYLDRCSLKDREIQNFAEVLETGQCPLLILDLGHNSIEETGVKHLSQALQSEKCGLRVLELMENPIGDKGAEHLSAALKNPSCQLLSLGLYGGDVMTSEGTLEILKAIPSSRMEHLNIGMHQVHSPLVMDVLRPALHHLKSLSCPAIHWLDELKSPDCTLELLQFGHWTNSDNWNEKANQTRSPLEHFGDIIQDVRKLEVLDVGNGEACCGAYTHLLAVITENYRCSLKVLRGADIPRQLELKCKSVLLHNEMLRKINYEDEVKPSYAAKLFVCGNSRVGKTTFTINLNRKVTFDCLQRHSSTEGIHMSELRFGNKKVVIYDLAGQSEYHTFHHYFIRGSDRDAFLVICKAEKGEGQDNFEKQLHYWLRFIAAHRASSMTRPRVMIGLNFFASESGNWTKEEMLDAPTTMTEYIRNLYKDVLNFGEGDQNMFGFIATKPNKLKLAKERIKCVANVLLEGKNIPKLCDQLIPFVRNMRMSARVISVEELVGKVNKSFQDEVAQEVIESALLHLHDMGEVVNLAITYSNLPSIVILDVKWFNQDVIRLFISNEVLRMKETRWRLRKENILMALLSIGCPKIYRLHILDCLNLMGVWLPADWARQQSNAPEELIIPTLLTKPFSSWDHTQLTDKFWGRRYNCEDTKTALLPSALFSMLQSRLQMQHKSWAEDRHDQGSYKVGNGWINFEIRNIVFVIKIGGPANNWMDHHWIDVFVKISEQEQANEASKLFSEIRDEVFRTCNDPGLGCPHLKLAEGVIDPNLVRQLSEAISDCTVPFARIKELLNLNGLKWKYRWEGQSQSSIVDILLPSESIEHGEKMLREIESIRFEAEIEESSNISSESYTEIFERGGIPECFEQLENRLGVRFDEVDKAVSNLPNLFANIIDKSKEMILSQCLKATVRLLPGESYPRLPYFKCQGSWSLTKLVGGKKLQLHAFCEGKIPHEIKDQKGVPVDVFPEWLCRVAPVLGSAIKLVWCATRMTVSQSFGMFALPTTDELGLPDLPRFRSWKNIMAWLPREGQQLEDVTVRQLKELYDLAFEEEEKRRRKDFQWTDPISTRAMVLEHLNLIYNPVKDIWVCEKCNLID